MPQRKRNELTKHTLIERIRAVRDSFDEATGMLVSRQQLLSKLLAVGGRISDDEFAATCDDEYKVLRCYLRTMVDSEHKRSVIEHYVTGSSLFFYRSQVILNLLCHRLLEIDFQRQDPSNPHSTLSYVWQNSQPIPNLEAFYNMLFSDGNKPNLLKFICLFEKYKNLPKYVPPRVKTVIQEHEAYIGHLKVPDWEKRLTRSGWDQWQGQAACKLRVAAMEKIQRAVRSNLKRYITSLAVDQNKQAILDILLKPLPSQRPSNVPNFYWDHILLIREATSCSPDDFMAQIPPMSLQLFSPYLHFWKIGLVRSRLMPLDSEDSWLRALPFLSILYRLYWHFCKFCKFCTACDFSRKFAFIDSRIYHFLFQAEFDDFRKRYRERDHPPGHNPDVGEMEEAFWKEEGFSTELFEEKQNQKRMNLRRDARGQEKALRKNHAWNRPKVSKKWIRRGKTKVGPGWRVSSIETNGVGLSLRFCRPKGLPQTDSSDHFPPPKRKKDFENEQKEAIKQLRFKDEEFRRPVWFGGCDLGRANIQYSAFSYQKSKEKRHNNLSRREYYRKIRSGNHRSESSDSKKQNALKGAMAALSEAGTNENRSLLAYLTAQSSHITILMSEKIISSVGGREKMMQARKKQAVLAATANDMINSSGPVKTHRVIAIGDCKIKPTGKREKSVPTSGIMKALEAARIRYNTAGMGPVSFLITNEFRTTKFSHCCDVETETVPVKKKTKKRKAVDDPKVQTRQLDRIAPFDRSIAVPI